MTIFGIGSDIIEIDRLRDMYHKHEEKFMEKLFTADEVAYCQRYQDPLPHFAGRFAAKEAIVKALGTGINPEISWLDIEILNAASGQPEVFLSPKILEHFGQLRVLVTISHCKAYATATALVLHD